MLSPTAKAIGSPSEQYALACCGTIDMTLILCEYLTPLFKLHGLEFSTLYGMVFFIENYYKRNKMYKVFLDGLEIATTKLEGGDPPMGVASGVLNFKDKNFGYKEIKEYCEKNNIETSTDEPEDKVICTMSLENYLKVINENGIEIKGVGGVNISGMDFDWYEIAILGIAYPFYENEFPELVKAYEEYFKK